MSVQTSSSQDYGHIWQPQSFFMLLYVPPSHLSLPLPLLQATTDLLYVIIDQFEFFRILNIWKNIFACTPFCLPLFTHINYSEIHLCCVYQFHLIAESYSTTCIVQFIISLVNGHLGCFQVWAIKHQSAIGLLCTSFYVDIGFSFLLGKYLGVEWLGHTVGVY